MWALIKREVEDMTGYVGVYLLFGTVLSGLMIYGHVYADEDFTQKVAIVFRLTVISACLVAGAFGVSQMYFDRTKRISTFLVSHAVGRRHVFWARVIAGTLVLLLFYVPVMVTGFAVAGRNSWYDPSFWFLVFGFVTAYGCFSLGLAMGNSSGKIVPSLGTLALVVLLLALIPIKGFSMDFLVIAGLFILAALGRAWQTFKQTAL